MKKIVCAALAICLFAAGSVSAREIPSSSPERQGFSSDRLDFLTDFMDAKVAQGTMVGGMGVIARNGKIVYSQTYGQADRERNEQWKLMQFTAFTP